MLFSRPRGIRRVHLTAVALIGTLAFFLTAAASARAELTLEGFLTLGDSSAGWITDTSPPTGSTDQDSISLFVNGTGITDLNDAARAVFGGVGGAAPPAQPPSFDYKVTTVGASGGSTRLVIRLSDGGRGELRPLALQANTWTRVNGTGENWDNVGGTCGFRTGVTYAAVLACHPGATVTGVEIINDSGWLYPGGFTMFADNISYGGETLTKPAPPELGESVVVTSVTGAIDVRLPEKIGGNQVAGDLARISGTATLPVGAVVDARSGHARIRSTRGRGTRQSAVFREGRFRVLQDRKRGAATQLSLRGKLDCPGRDGDDARSSSAGPVAQASARRRRLWGRGRGSFRTRGSYSSGSVRGTEWLTEDRCNGTLTRVRSGVVEVRDFVQHLTVFVRAGESYFAKRRAD
jgi:hypothetical protein